MTFLKTIGIILLILAFPANAKPPNIVVIFADDLGYGDLACYGSKKSKTPSIDKLAQEGMRFTDFLVPANVCGPSRAALLTGRYPMRCGHPVARSSVLPKYNKYGLVPDEITIAELLKPAGYRNLLVGKWHLGFEVEGSHPLDAGFDESYGIASNYGTKLPTTQVLYRGREIEKQKARFEELTTLYTDEVVNFIAREKERPFFILMAHHIPHTPILPSEKFKGLTQKGPYTDLIAELDHSTGRIMKALKDHGLDNNTLVVFTSDNGPAKDGSAGKLLGGKYVTTEGGHRVPAIIRWPGKTPANVISHTTITSMDLLPLFCHLAGVAVPSDRTIDGKNITNIILGKSDKTPHDLISYHNGTNLQAIRQGKWKLHLPRSINDQPFWAKRAGGNRKKVLLQIDKPLLFNLDTDPGEKNNLASKHPDILNRLTKEANRVRAELGNLDQIGSDQRIPNLKDPQIK